MAEIDTSRTIEIDASPWKQVILTLGSAVFVADGCFIIRDAVGLRRYSPEFIQFWGWVTIVFFGLCGLIGLGTKTTHAELLGTAIRFAGRCGVRRRRSLWQAAPGMGEERPLARY